MYSYRNMLVLDVGLGVVREIHIDGVTGRIWDRRRQQDLGFRAPGEGFLGMTRYRLEY